MSRNKWIITKDLIGDKFGDKSEVGIQSRGKTIEDPMSLPVRFKMYDDDGEIYYEGRMSIEDFEPLDDFGMPNAGCTEIKTSKNGKAFQTL